MTAGPAPLEHLDASRATPGTTPGTSLGRRWRALLVLGVAAGAAAAAALGLSVGGVYDGDRATAEMLRGYDLVTLVAAVPLLLLGLGASLRGSLLGRVVAAAMLLYLAYTYAYYLFGTGFNDLLLLHAAVFTGSLAALVPCLRDLADAVVLRPPVPRPADRMAAVLLGVLASSLGLMWVYACVAFAVNGDVPAGSTLVETDTVVHLGIVLDLTVLVPLYATAAVWLWQRRAWGYVLAAVAAVSGTLHQLGYLVALLFQDAGDVPGSVPFDRLEPVILLVYLVATAAVLRSLGGAPHARRGGAPRSGPGAVRES